MIFLGRQKFLPICFGVALGIAFFLAGCATQQETMDLKPHVNKVILQVHELANQVYDLENRLRRLEKRETQIPDHVRRLADLEARLDTLQQETHSHFIAEQENMNLWNKYDQKFRDLQQELENERKEFLQFQEETMKRCEELSRTSEGAIFQGKEEKQILEGAPGPDTSVIPGPTLNGTAAVPLPVKADDEKSVYEDAYRTFTQEDWSAAREKFQAFLQRYPDSSLSDNSQFWIGESFYKQKEYERAILEYEKVIQSYPQGDKLPSALLKQAFSFLAIGRIKEAGILLNQVIKTAPNSEQAKTAKKKLEALTEE